VRLFGALENDDYAQPDARRFGRDSVTVHAQWEHTNGHQRVNNNTHGRGAALRQRNGRDEK